MLGGIRSTISTNDSVRAGLTALDGLMVARLNPTCSWRRWGRRRPRKRSRDI